MVIFFLTIGKALSALFRSLEDPEYRTLAIVAIVVVAGGMIFYRQTEGWSWLNSLYFCTVALLTVGFGDLTPTSPISKIFTIAYLYIGVGLFATFLQLLVKKRERRDGSKKRKLL